MPLFATLALNFVVGALAALAAARELRASPRPAYRSRAFRALGTHELLVAMPIGAFVLVRFTDWSVSYLFNGSRLPSAVVLALVLAHGGLAVAGFSLGARLLRDHRPHWIRGIAIAVGCALLLGGVALHRRLGTVATYAQYRGGFGLRTWRDSPVLGATVGLSAGWALAAAHLFWSLLRRL